MSTFADGLSGNACRYPVYGLHVSDKETVPCWVEPVERQIREIAWEGEVRGRELQEPAPRVDLGHLIGPKAAQEANLAIRGLGPRQSLTGQDASSILCG